MSDTPTSQAGMFSDLVQIGVVVRDLDRAIAFLSDVLGIGPFRTITWPPPDRTDIQRTYHGEPGDFSARMAFAELGSIELELIQPLEGESIWSDFLKQRGEGIHHIRFNTANTRPLIQYLAEHGIKVSQRGSGLRPGTEWAYFDTESEIGFIVEIMNVLPGTGGRTPQIVDGKVEV